MLTEWEARGRPHCRLQRHRALIDLCVITAYIFSSQLRFGLRQNLAFEGDKTETKQPSFHKRASRSRSLNKQVRMNVSP